MVYKSMSDKTKCSFYNAHCLKTLHTVQVYNPNSIFKHWLNNATVL